MSTIKKDSISKGTSILILSTILVKIIGALFKIPISSDYCLGNLGFGYFSTAYDFYAPINVLAITGFPTILSKMISELCAKNDFLKAQKVFKTAKKLIILIGLTGSLLIALFAYPYVLITDATRQSLYSILAVAPCLLFSSVSAVYRGYYIGMSNMKPTAVSNIIEALCKLILGFTAAYITVKLTGNVALGSAAALLGITIGTVLSAVYLFSLYKRDNKNEIKAEHNKGEFGDISKIILKLTVPVIVISLISNIPILIDAITVKFQLNNNFSENSDLFEVIYKELFSDYSHIIDIDLATFFYGIKSKAYTLFNLIPIFAAMVGVSAVPEVSAFYSLGNKDNTKNAILNSLKLSSIISFPISFGFMAISTGITALLYGDTSSSVLCGEMLFIYGICGLFAGASVVLGNLLLGINLQRKAFRNIIIGIIVKLLVNILLSLNVNINIFGCVYGTLAFFIVIFILNIMSLSKTVKIKEISKVYLKPLIPAIVCGICANIIYKINSLSFNTLVAIGVAAVVYGVLLLLLKVIHLEEFSKILGNKYSEKYVKDKK